MKKYFGVMAVLAVTALLFSACQGGSCKKEQAAGETPAVEGTEGATAPATAPVDIKNADKLSKSLSSALCKRMVECAPGTMTEDECVTQTTASLMEVQKEKPLNVADADLDKCIASITGGTCETVLGTEPPAGCEFLR